MSEDKKDQTLGAFHFSRSGGRLKTLPPPHLRSLSSNDYLGLSRHPQVVEASIRATRESGTGATGSRYLSGNHALNGELEESTARFKTGGGGRAILFSSGYHANLAVMSFAGELSGIIFSDADNHASLIDGMRLAQAEKIVYPHNDADFVRDFLKKHPARPPIIVTESVFSMKGDMAPLRELYEIAALQGGLLVIDDAHATGTLGRSGRGGLEQIDLPFDPEHMIVTGTFSKALGSLGGFAVLAEETSRTLSSTARTLIYTTALPPGVLAASLEALRLIESSPVMVEKLQEASLYWQRSLTGRESPSPIIALSGDPSRLSGLSKEMGLRGFHLPLLTYPTVPKGEETLRLSVNTNWDETVVSALEDILTPERRGFR